MKFLVTGGAGYVGVELVKQLLGLRQEVVVVDNLQRGGKSLLPFVNNPNFNFVNADLAIGVPTEIKDFDACFHLAGLVGAPACQADPELSYLYNVQVTNNIVNFLAGERLVFASTGSVYGKLDETCTEDSPTNPSSEYGEHKYIAERVAAMYKNSISLRFATACGVSGNMRGDLLLHTLVKTAIKDRKIEVYEGHARRTFVHVREMASAMIQAVEPKRYNLYNCGSKNISKIELAEAVGRVLNCPVYEIEGQPDPDKRDYEVCYDRFNAEFRECKFDLEDTIREVAKAIRLL